MTLQKTKRIQRFWKCLFLIYILILIYFMFFFEAYDRNMENRKYLYNLIPFKEILRFWKYRKTLGIDVVILNLLGNIVGFIPFGMLLPFLYPKKARFIAAVGITAEFSILLEVSQLIFRVGSCDVDDIILNTLGGAAGYLLYLIFRLIRREENG